MTNNHSGRYVKDIKIALLVALIFIAVLFVLFMADLKLGVSDRIANVFVSKIYGGG